MGKNDKNESANESKSERDIRVDMIGFCNKVRDHGGSVAKKVKLLAIIKQMEEITGDYFVGKLTPSSQRTVNAAKFYKLFKAGKITEPQFLKAIRVDNKAAEKLLADEELKKISKTSKGSIRLNVDLIDGMGFNLDEALEAIKSDMATGRKSPKSAMKLAAA